jgi:exopolyphosphatase/guanosine-5'-triphosphate,3'-diphosphate pyrophosphatase
MKKIRVTTKYGEYPVFIGKSILPVFRDKVDYYDKVLLLTDGNVRGHYLDEIGQLQEHVPNVFLYRLEDGKTDRTLATVRQIYDFLIEHNFTQKSGVINFGGESICDIGGFVSATFRGGIDSIEIPTSLAAMINSGTNGTFSVDHERSKSSICITKYPTLVINDTDFLDTLPPEDLTAGFAEAVKCALISYKTDNKALYYFLEKYREELLARHPKRLVEMLDECCRTEKAAIDARRFRGSREFFLKLGYEYAGFLASRPDCGTLSWGDLLAKGILFQFELARRLHGIGEKFIKEVAGLFRDFGLDPLPVALGETDLLKFADKNPDFVLMREDYDLIREPVPYEILQAANDAFDREDYFAEVLGAAGKKTGVDVSADAPERILRKAVIDIGTNSVRLLVGEVREKGGKLTLTEELTRRVEIVRLGEDVNKTGILKKAAMERTLAALRTYRDIAVSLGATDIKAFATSAVRDARNRNEFLEAVRAIPLSIEVISGLEEGKLNYLGNAAVFDGRILVVDIGGGSTEFSLGEGGEAEIVKSIDIGSVRGTELFFKDGYSEENLRRFHQWVSENLDALDGIVSFARDNYAVVAVAGTATTQISVRDKMAVYDPARVHLARITVEELQQNLDLFLARNRGEVREITGLLKKREDVIAAGTMILITILKRLLRDEVIVSESDNLVGAITEL